MSFAKNALLVSSVLALGAGMSASAAEKLNGAGASFPAKIYQRWFADLAKSGGPQVNYQAVGSGSGRKAFIDQTVNFGASDDPMQKADMPRSPVVWFRSRWWVAPLPSATTSPVAT